MGWSILIPLGMLICVPLVIIILATRAYMPWIFERLTPEQKIMHDMLAFIAADPEEWTNIGYYCFRHETGVIILDELGYLVSLEGDVTRYGRNTRIGRICANLLRQIKEREARGKTLSTLKKFTTAMNGWQ